MARMTLLPIQADRQPRARYFERMAELTASALEEVLALANRLFDEMIDQQRVKVLRLAREAVPHISAEDVMNPDDYPELKAHPTFEYEDGILAGLIAAQMALRAEINPRTAPTLPPP
jgi:hypothetical protein